MEDERKRVKFVYEVYSNPIGLDAADLMDCVRCCNLNPTISLVKSLGATEHKGERVFSFEEFWEIYAKLKNDKNEGGFVDFVECLKIFDVGENGKMKLGDLSNMLLSLGERVTPTELTKVLEDCMLEEEDDDGWIDYIPFLCRLCEVPIPKGFPGHA